MRKFRDREESFRSSEADRRRSIQFDRHPIKIPKDKTTNIAFILLSGFSSFGLTAFLTPFQNANAIIGHTQLRWSFASVDGSTVACSLVS